MAAILISLIILNYLSPSMDPQNSLNENDLQSRCFLTISFTPEEITIKIIKIRQVTESNKSCRQQPMSVPDARGISYLCINLVRLLQNLVRPATCVGRNNHMLL
jgi:hypothetical protein